MNVLRISAPAWVDHLRGRVALNAVILSRKSLIGRGFCQGLPSFLSETTARDAERATEKLAVQAALARGLQSLPYRETAVFPTNHVTSIEVTGCEKG